MGANHCGDSRRTVFKHRESFQDLSCRRDSTERGVDSFSHQIQSEYYCGNIYISIEGISLKRFSALPHTDINSSIKPCPLQSVFHSFFSDDSKQDSATTTAHIKHLIELLKENIY